MEQTKEKRSFWQRRSEEKNLRPAQLRQRKVRRQKLLRAGIQTIFFFTIPGAFVAGFTGVKQLFRWIGEGTVLQIDGFVLALIGLLAFTVLFGRYFCGFVCAFGSLGDFVYWLSGLVQKKVLRRKKQLRLPEQFVLLGQKVKYVVLMAIVLLCCLGVYDSLTGWSPWDVFASLTALRAPGAGYLVGIVLLVLLLSGMAIHPRFFCQFLCPMGAVFSLLPVPPQASLQRGEQCIPTCNACARQCPVSLKLDAAGKRAGECIACEACVNSCPRNNISRWDLKHIPHAWISVVGKAVLFFVLGAYLGLCRFL